MDAIVCGFGNLGFRHVEGLITSKVVKQISIVEISESTFVKNMDRVNTLEDYSKNVFRFSSLENVLRMSIWQS